MLQNHHENHDSKITSIVVQEAIIIISRCIQYWLNTMNIIQTWKNKDSNGEKKKSSKYLDDKWWWKNQEVKFSFQSVKKEKDRSCKRIETKLVDCWSLTMISTTINIYTIETETHNNIIIYRKFIWTKVKKVLLNQIRD